MAIRKKPATKAKSKAAVKTAPKVAVTSKQRRAMPLAVIEPQRTAKRKVASPVARPKKSSPGLDSKASGLESKATGLESKASAGPKSQSPAKTDSKTVKPTTTPAIADKAAGKGQAEATQGLSPLSLIVRQQALAMSIFSDMLRTQRLFTEMWRLPKK